MTKRRTQETPERRMMEALAPRELVVRDDHNQCQGDVEAQWWWTQMGLDKVDRLTLSLDVIRDHQDH